MLRSVGLLVVAFVGGAAMGPSGGLAATVKLSDPKVTIARAKDVIPADLLPRAGRNLATVAGAEAAGNEPVFLIEFSANTDLRALAKKYETVITGRVYLCSKSYDSEPTFSADVIADKSGWILPQGGRFPGPPEFAAPAGRYLLYVSNDSTEAINLGASGQPVPDNARLETLREDLCMTIEAYGFDHPLARSEVMRISKASIREAWKSYVAKGEQQNLQ